LIVSALASCSVWIGSAVLAPFAVTVSCVRTATDDGSVRTIRNQRASIPVPYASAASHRSRTAAPNCSICRSSVTQKSKTVSSGGLGGGLEYSHWRSGLPRVADGLKLSASVSVQPHTSQKPRSTSVPLGGTGGDGGGIVLVPSGSSKLSARGSAQALGGGAGGLGGDG
jgi:hypothetical protein